MEKTDCFQLGYIAKLHGFKGEVSLFLDVTEPEKYATLDAFYVDINNQLIPFFVENIKLKNKGFAAGKRIIAEIGLFAKSNIGRLR
jgi:16S rRNA processing protein RimM